MTTQFKTNYKTIKINTIVGDTKTSITPTKKSDHIGRKDRRDATKIDLDGQTGYYFDNGNIYNYASGVKLSEYSLQGRLPIWGVVGNFLYDNGWHEIVDVLFDDDRNAEILVVETSYSGNDISVEVKSIYNLFDYEVYEFELSLASYNSLQIEIVFEDPNYPNVTFLSEHISVEEKQENTIYIAYSNDINTEMVYATGIVNKIRIPYEYKRAGYEDDTETNKTDNAAILVSSQQYPTKKFELSPVSEGLMRKIYTALSATDVTIDGTRFIKGSIETNSLEDTNLYTISATMILATQALIDTYALSVESQASEDILLKANNGFIKI